ncbi:MAG: YihY/virulence factor BrkB family protein [Fibromonadaceae bacterium]|jgi:membrane protein|nr:YihY/virulence factor BrkB family protein [Fibromonadaceae bacterium]
MNEPIEKPDLWMKLDIWMSKRSLPIRIIYDSIRIFLLEHCTIRATALAYTSLLAAVPLLILLTSISLSIGVGDLFITHLPTLLPEILEKVMPYINEALYLLLPGIAIDLNTMAKIVLENVMPFLVKAQGINLGSLGVIGAIGLLATFILAIDTIETNMNIVWGVNESRGYGQKAAIFIPFLLLFAGGIGILSMLLNYMHEILEDILVQKLPFGKFGELLASLSIPIVLQILALFGLWLLYCYMPYVPEKHGFWKAIAKKTKKRWFSSIISAFFTFAAAGGFCTAMVFLQAGMFAKWSLFYGSLAVFPMIMFMLFGLWCIILFGNALCWRITERKNPQEYFLRRIANLSGFKNEKQIQQ